MPVLFVVFAGVVCLCCFRVIGSGGSDIGVGLGNCLIYGLFIVLQYVCLLCCSFVLFGV